jgi:hypothetical protein
MHIFTRLFAVTLGLLVFPPSNSSQIAVALGR